MHPRRPLLRPELLTRAKAMRAAPTAAENELWHALRAGRCDGLKVRRQMPIGLYIADFVVPAAKLIIEIDGGSHADLAAEDALRSAWLAEQGYRVLRFSNAEVVEQLDAVLRTILFEARRPLSPLGVDAESPSPLKGEG